MRVGKSCPYCGQGLLTGETPRRATDVETIELLNREVQRLRETVAMLRGSLGAPRATHGAYPQPGGTS